MGVGSVGSMQQLTWFRRARRLKGAIGVMVMIVGAFPVAVVGGAPAAGAATPGTASPARGYWMTTADGHVYGYGEAATVGSLAGTRLNRPVVGMAATPSGKGYWMVASDGGVFNFGDAPFTGSAGAIKLVQPIVGMSATLSGNGYWMVASDGGIFAFGDAGFLGSMGGRPLNRPIISMASTPSGRGYWLVASDGGMFSFGDAKFFGSTGSIKLNRPIVGMTPTPSGRGYWLVASDGGIFSYGDAAFYGSTGSLSLKAPITGMAASPSGRGYWVVASDGGVFAYGDAAFAGSAGSEKLRAPVIGMTAMRARHGSEVIAFYYPWWGSPQYDGGWFHWDQNGYSPPDFVASNYYPLRGAYSVADPAVLEAQFTEMAAAGIDEVVVSWWGQDSFEDRHLAAVAKAAAGHGVRVGIHIEPYYGRSAVSVDSDIGSLKRLGYTDFWLYFANALPASQLRDVMDRAGPVRVFGSATDINSVGTGAFQDFAAATHLTGVYTYDPYYFNAVDFPGICGAARMRNLLCSPGVAPGFYGLRATNINRIKGRLNGATYDERWQGAITGGADTVGIVSYNEWHEGSQIEPVANSACPSDPNCYADFVGAYGKAGADAPRAYLDRTLLWSNRFKGK